MGKVYNNLITTTSGFKYSAKQPLDDRAVVESYIDLTELVTYEGMEVYVVADKKSYKLIGDGWIPVATESYVNQQIELVELSKANKNHNHSIGDITDYSEPDLSPYAEKIDIPVEYSNSANKSIVNKIYSDNPAYVPVNNGIESIAFGGYRIDKALSNGTPDDEDNATTIYEGADQSYAFGPGHDIYGRWNFAAGKDAKTYQRASIALGNGCTAGDINKPNAYGSIAMGIGTTSTGYGSLAIGTQTIASALGSFAFGTRSSVDADYAAAGGVDTAVHAGAAFGFGTGCVINSTAASGATFGSRNVLNATHTYAFGQDLECNGAYCVAIGHWNVGSEDNYFEIGKGTTASNRLNAFEVTKTGVARSYGTPSGDNDLVTVKYFNDNKPTFILPSYLTQRKPIFGWSQTVEEACTDVLVSGRENTVNSSYSIIGGINNKATGQKQFVSGNDNEVTCTLGFAHGAGLKVNTWGQMAFGTYNDPSSGARFMIGVGGSEASRKNAFEVYGDGKVCVRTAPDGSDPNAVVRYMEFANLTGEIDTAIQELSDSVDVKLMAKASNEDVTNAINAAALLTQGTGNGSIQQVPYSYDDDGEVVECVASATNSGSIAFGENCLSSGIDSFAGGKNSEATNKRAFAYGNGCKSYGNSAATFGQTNYNNASGALMFGSSNILEDGGGYSLVGGFKNTANVANSIIVGRENIIEQGNFVSVFGVGNKGNIASNEASYGFVAGNENTYTRPHTHILGRRNESNYERTTLIGHYLTADNAGQTVMGRYNAPNAHGAGLFTFGVGTDINDRRNAIEISDKIYLDIETVAETATIKQSIIDSASITTLDATTATANRLTTNGLTVNGAANVSGFTTFTNGVKLGTTLYFNDAASIGVLNTKDSNFTKIAMWDKPNNKTACLARGTATTALGDGTIADRYGQTVVGRFNDNTTDSGAVFVVGNGTSNEQRSNALAVFADGGKVKVYSAPVDAEDVVRKQDLDTCLHEVSTNKIYEYETAYLDDMFFGNSMDPKKELAGEGWEIITYTEFEEALDVGGKFKFTLVSSMQDGATANMHVFDDHDSSYDETFLGTPTSNPTGNIEDISIGRKEFEVEFPAMVDPVVNIERGDIEGIHIWRKQVKILTPELDSYNVILNRKLPETEAILDFTQIILTGYVNYNLPNENRTVGGYFDFDLTRQCKGIKKEDGLQSFMIFGNFCSLHEQDTPVHTFSAKVTCSIHENYEFRLHGIEAFKIDGSVSNGKGVVCGNMSNIRCRTILASGIQQLCE